MPNNHKDRSKKQIYRLNYIFSPVHSISILIVILAPNNPDFNHQFTSIDYRHYEMHLFKASDAEYQRNCCNP